VILFNQIVGQGGATGWKCDVASQTMVFHSAMVLFEFTSMTLLPFVVPQ